ncbi:MAG: zinc-dependent metalloprotease, partial [Bacteroidetes bacterium]|nr:zinc-dependent metalloprotease [Bacteroidota bacterium]
ARAYHRDSVTGSQSTVLEWTELVNSDNDLFFFGPMKVRMSIGAYQADKSYLSDIRSFPMNTEIKTVKTYTKAPAAMQSVNGVVSAIGLPRPLTVELNTSIVLLPAVPMQPRYADRRVGYFSSEYTDFDADPQGVKKITMIERWRLQPRAGDMDKYRSGALVEPEKPIVIYIDPATPAKWVPYLIQGINDWQPAFEHAGFKNAIIGKTAPTPQEDPSWSLDDARHSAIVYKSSAVPNASGPHITDPRSGEVLETHINWYHNVMKLLHDWYFIQTAAVDPRARHMEFDDSLMGQLIRFVVSHEVGHTLGLLHNFGASSATPVEKLRDKAWVEAHGHTSSIMDYARFNYVAQPEDNISESGLFPRIGDYDNWAIEWGYRLIPGAASAVEEKPVLNQWVITHSKDRKYWFGNESDPDDPRSQNEDLGDNAMKAGGYGIKNLRRILGHLVEWTNEPNEDDENLQDMYRQLTMQLSRYIGHVVKNIGGSYENLKTVEQPGPVYEPVPAALQHEAVLFLNEQVFATPEWLLDKKLVSRIGISPLPVVGSLQ